ncbi:hypothetical protein OCC_02867 [Thermococcus litoralis DSM 5473]|uniref:Uncharacterized protein n=1 Tax=Thermococcus litoralis (strain ATCC 51850 / DSM 5473 / JCM 8560 / NS-C) TaxID=523849 RepID=H3ZPZ5_THELN|nr:hypothetical protein [Thermococcus litoralis]EHR77958.1 hypothetical protein OCC_02867 [Thermococcus litoralis DSM 5473]
MNFRGMKLILPIIIYMIVGFGPASAASFYIWTSSIHVGEKVQVNDIILTVDKDIRTGALALVVEGEGKLLFDGQKMQVENLNISFTVFGNYGVVTVESAEPFSVNTNGDIQALKEENKRLKAENVSLTKQVKSLQKENEKLKQQVSELQNKLKDLPNAAALNVQIVNLTKENRELKAQLANITNKYNALQAKADFLEQQNEEYRKMIQTLLQEASQKSEQSYIEKAKKEKLIGSVIIKTLIAAGGIVGLIGFLLYRGKRSWEYGGL